MTTTTRTMTPTKAQLSLLRSLPSPVTDLDMRTANAALRRGWAARDGDTLRRTPDGDALIASDDLPPPVPAGVVRLMLVDAAREETMILRAEVVASGPTTAALARKISDTYPADRFIVINQWFGVKPGRKEL